MKKKERKKEIHKQTQSLKTFGKKQKKNLNKNSMIIFKFQNILLLHSSDFIHAFHIIIIIWMACIFQQPVEKHFADFHPKIQTKQKKLHEFSVKK